MTKNHSYQVEVQWTGNTGKGTQSYRAYERSHEIKSGDKPLILGSSDPNFRGDKTKYNPEELLVASLASCHMLWYLHLCSEAKIVVVDYCDRAVGTMIETQDGGGRFAEVILKPIVTITSTNDPAIATSLHEQAHHLCFIANSVNFPVGCEPSIIIVE
jgi:organic hydroperoxide reductase OsmC/OhrA